jgi:hypothetical protein
VVGEGDNPRYDPDRLYVLLKLPPEPHTFKVVVGWKDRGNLIHQSGGQGD